MDPQANARTGYGDGLAFLILVGLVYLATIVFGLIWAPAAVYWAVVVFIPLAAAGLYIFAFELSVADHSED